MTPFKKCPKGILGDIQLESILTPIMFRRSRPDVFLWHSPVDTQPELRILDVGCGWGRLLGGLAVYPPYITQRLHYVGCEESRQTLEANVVTYQDILDSMSEDERLENRLASVEFATWDDLLDKGEDIFDYVYLVNVLHHVPPMEIPNVYRQIFSLVKEDGYLIIHDFFFDAYDSNIDLQRYCENSVFFSPRHVSAFFSMASTQTGLYRTIPRWGTDGRYCLFTLVLQFSNELSKDAFRHKDDFFTYEYLPAGIYASLVEIAHDLAKVKESDWFSRYYSLILSARDSVRERWKYQLQDSIAVNVAERWLARTKGSE